MLVASVNSTSLLLLQLNASATTDYFRGMTTINTFVIVDSGEIDTSVVVDSEEIDSSVIVGSERNNTSAIINSERLDTSRGF